MNKKGTKHTFSSDFLCAVQRADNPRDHFSEGQVVNPVRKVISCNTKRLIITIS